MQRYLALAAAAALCTFPASAADDSNPKTNAETKAAATPNDEITKLIDVANGKKVEGRIHDLTSAVDAKLRNKDTADATVKLLVDRRKEFALGPVVEKRLDAIIAEKKDDAAARLLLQCVKAKLVVTSMRKGGVAIGQVVVEDGKLDTHWVLAQMQIYPGGYFAGEVGDMTKPIGFRAAGYEEVLAPLSGKPGEFFDVGTATLKPMAKDKAATFKGKVELEIADRGPATLSISLGVPRPNTPHGGYSPRTGGWPQPAKVTVEKDGTFSIGGLTPGDYYLQVQAKDHANEAKPIKLEAGKVTDYGVLKLATTDLGHYIGKAAPKTGELPWEKDYSAAAAKAESEKKPMMVMMTATWCGPCKALEKNVLNDAWVKHFLADYVIVKAYEDKDVEKKYGMNGYPTLVFTDSSGKEMHRTVGNQSSTKFLGNVVKASKKLSVKLPPELQTLVDKKVVD